MRFSIEEILKATAGKLACSPTQSQLPFLEKLSTDTRTLTPDDWFLALRGERFDGHRFVQQALQRGVRGFILEEGAMGEGVFSAWGVPVILVRDSLRALGDLAAFGRRQVAIPVLALTGSNGKTTTRAMCGTLLAQHFRVHQSHGNFNNLVGVPLTMLELSQEHELMVLEMGMNHLGEIARLTQIAQPTLALITNVGPVHLEFLKNVETVAQAKGELFDHLSPDARVVVNLDDPFCEGLAERAGIEKNRRVRFGWKRPGEVYVMKTQVQGIRGVKVWLGERLSGAERTLTVTLPLVGEHNVYNLLAAVTCGLALGLSHEEIQQGVPLIEPVGNRSRILSLADERVLIDDCYNANAASMAAALTLLRDLAGSCPTLAVMGEMLELGEAAAEAHYRLGELAGQKGIQDLFFVGAHGDEVLRGALAGGLTRSKIRIFATLPREKPSDQMISVVRDELSRAFVSGGWLLVKGSRGMALERVVEAIKDRYKMEKENLA